MQLDDLLASELDLPTLLVQDVVAGAIHETVLLIDDVLIALNVLDRAQGLGQAGLQLGTGQVVKAFEGKS